MYSLSLTEDELLFILVLYGVTDDEKFRDYGLSPTDTTAERLKKGEESLRTREIVTGEEGVPYLNDEATALVGTTIVNDAREHVYTDDETGLSVRFTHEEGMYLFKGTLEE
ncbi:hypothetical protein IPM65_07650 [Candidatus Roizmanbacteria bacterium]|nr:MAG: hypothetical protein IPM65_07650 [Candidatus Roizmanbacteria bacterium]